MGQVSKGVGGPAQFHSGLYNGIILYLIYHDRSMSLRNNNQDWRVGSISILCLPHQNPHEKPDMVACACDPSPGRERQVDSWCPMASQISLIRESQASKRPCHKKVDSTGGEMAPITSSNTHKENIRNSHHFLKCVCSWRLKVRSLEV